MEIIVLALVEVLALAVVIVLAAGDDLIRFKLCIGLSNFKNLIINLRSTTLEEVSQLLAIFSFVLVVFSLLRYHAYFPCESFSDLCDEIAYHRSHIGKASGVCVLWQYAFLASHNHGSNHYQHILDKYI